MKSQRQESKIKFQNKFNRAIAQQSNLTIRSSLAKPTSSSSSQSMLSRSVVVKDSCLNTSTSAATTNIKNQTKITPSKMSLIGCSINKFKPKCKEVNVNLNNSLTTCNVRASISDPSKPKFQSLIRKPKEQVKNVQLNLNQSSYNDID